LSRSHKVIAIDLFGYGDTPFPLLIHDFGLRDEARLVQWVLAETLEADETFHLIGHSYGGAVALHTWRIAPQRLKPGAVRAYGLSSACAQGRDHDRRAGAD
jgi:pimeloyl-ACP methyl ester carboxylesterase